MPPSFCDFHSKSTLPSLHRNAQQCLELQKLSPQQSGRRNSLIPKAPNGKTWYVDDQKPYLRTQSFMLQLRNVALLNLLRCYSQRNTYMPKVVSAYMYATGAHRQHLSVLGSLGTTVGYSSLLQKKQARKVTPRPGKAPKIRQARSEGVVLQLSQSQRLAARKLAATGCYALVYDNINIMYRVAEQVLGRKSSILNLPLFRTAADPSYRRSGKRDLCHYIPSVGCFIRRHETIRCRKGLPRSATTVR